MIVTVLMIVADNSETFTLHDSAAAAWTALVSYVNRRWSFRFPMKPVPIVAEERVDEFFVHGDEFYALGEADVTQLASELDGRPNRPIW